MFKKKAAAKVTSPTMEDAVVQEIISGTPTSVSAFEKLKSGSRKNYNVTLDGSGTFLRAGTKKTIDITHVKEIRVGYMTQEFLTHGEAKKIPEPHAISIVYHDEKSVRPKILNLVAENKDQHNWWSKALQALVDHINDVSVNGKC